MGGVVRLATGLAMIGVASMISQSRAAHGVVISALPVLVAEDFENGMQRWQPSDPEPAESVWHIAAEPLDDSNGANHVFRVTGQSNYQPPYRSPHSIAWLKDVRVGDFELTARVQNTSPDAGPHRDLCIFWGRQSPSQYYYVHLGAKADPHACQIFLVNNEDRKAITIDEAVGTPWTDGWHNVKVVRKLADGIVEVYFDDMTKPLMTAKDTTFGAGEVGLGTFDDSGHFDDVILRGKP